MKWTVGVITAPRARGYYLGRTLESIKQVGWDNVSVFAEPDSIIPDDFQGYVVRRPKPFGDWTNWATGLYQLFLSEPDTDYFAMFEDDVVFCRGVKEYLERWMAELGEFASLSIYTPSRYCRRMFHGFHNECQGWTTWSTVTVIMKQESVLRFFADIDVQRHRFSDLTAKGVPEGSYGTARTSLVDRVGNTVKDAVIGRWAEKNGLPVFYHTPSLAEHIGFYSTLTANESTPDNGRMSRDFVGEDFNALTLETPFIKRSIQCQVF